MTLDTFFEKFDLFADAPDAVAKMRELVLQLAVTGKLVAQDQRDEPASVLLESMEAERAKLVASKKIKSRPTAPVESDEQPFDLPSSWAWARLSDVGYELGQKVPDKRFTYIDVGGIDSDKGRISDRVEKLEAGDAPSRARKLVTRGTVIYSTVRPYLLNIAIVDQDFDPEPIASTAFGILHPFAGINNRYLFYWLRSAPFTAYVQAGMKGMAYPAINDEKFYRGFIALPPLAEQKRIVAKVDELMALCDRLEAQQQEREAKASQLARASLARFADAPTPANLSYLFHSSFIIHPSDLRKSILTLAVQGKLVPQDPNDEPAEELLARIARKRTELLKAAYPNRDEASTQMRKQEAQMLPDGLESLAPGWSWATLIQASLLVVDCHNKTAPYVPSGIRLLRTTNIRDGRLNLTEPKFVDDETYERWSARCKPEPGDVLITREAPMGEVCIIPEGMKVCLGQRMMLIRLVPGTMDQKYLLYSLMAPDLMERVQDKPVGATVQHLRVGGVETLLTPIPPLAEQRRIVAKVEQLMALVDALETQLAASRTTAANLLSALVAELTVKGAECHE